MPSAPLGMFSSGFYKLLAGMIDYFNLSNLGTGPNASIIDARVQPDGKILVVGDFTTWNGVSVNRIVRLNTNLTMDTTFATNIGTGANSRISRVVIDVVDNNKIVILGSFNAWNGTAVNYMVRLNSNGTRDTSFTVPSGVITSPNGDLYLMDMAVSADSSIFLVAYDPSYYGYVIRLNSDGTKNTTFATNTGTPSQFSFPLKIAIHPFDGRILIGGNIFSQWYGVASSSIVCLNYDGTRNTSFTANIGAGPNSVVNDIKVQQDGKILVSGSFTQWNGVVVNYMVRLNSNGTRDTSFTSGLEQLSSGFNAVSSIIPQPDGKIMTIIAYVPDDPEISGTYSSMSRLNSNGTIDSSFPANNGNNSSAARIQSDGKILVYGFFSKWNGSYMNRITSVASTDSI